MKSAIESWSAAFVSYHYTDLSLAIPIGIHVDKQLKRAMTSLKAFDSFGDLIFFSFGVQH